MGFNKVFNSYSWEDIKQSIYAKTENEVRVALHKNGRRNLEDFKALISPAAMPFLEEMAGISQHLTQKRFGKTIQMYIPLYLSNACQNICTYCGFSLDNAIRRTTLTDAQIVSEIEVIKAFGYDQVLLVTGEANKTVGVEYLKNAVKLAGKYFSTVAIEVQPLETDAYVSLIQEGLNAVLVYQETYNRADYKHHHPKGKKSNFDYRLETPDRLGAAGIHKIGLGVLIGLEDWRTDSFFTALHLNYLEKQYWKTKFSISFPRLRPATGMLEPKVIMEDAELVQLICAYRIFNQDVDLSISTRERPVFRDHIVKLGITTLSAGSKTNPGGYSIPEESLEQFEISDERSPSDIALMIQKNGYEPVWKDWDEMLQQKNSLC